MQARTAVGKGEQGPLRDADLNNYREGMRGQCKENVLDEKKKEKKGKKCRVRLFIRFFAFS